MADPAKMVRATGVEIGHGANKCVRCKCLMLGFRGVRYLCPVCVQALSDRGIRSLRGWWTTAEIEDVANGVSVPFHI